MTLFQLRMLHLSIKIKFRFSVQGIHVTSLTSCEAVIAIRHVISECEVLVECEPQAFDHGRGSDARSHCLFPSRMLRTK